MRLSKAKLSLLTVVTASAIALSGTFAWQSISQQALNEAEKPSNPGGRLHDDFSGWEEGCTKDIYVENFGSQSIYARVRLDEYMEIGDGAGLKTGEAGAATKRAASLVAGADINDVTTWSTHIPDSTLTPGTPQTPADAEAHPFHDYWTWTMGGQTVYMPTFNKNKDSLKADINGTWDGADPTDEVHYDDYHAFSADETADGVRDSSVGKGAFYDCDDNTTDEGGLYGNGGVEGTNYEVKEETHTAKSTESGKVMTMAEWKALSDAEKATVKAWVYDADGWAYWSQPIAPDTATGLLLDSIALDNEPTDAWYYGINAVAQFITADSLGRADKTGFYTAGSAEPTEDALALLESIGVDAASVKGSIAISAQVGTPPQTQAVNYAAPGMTLRLEQTVSVDGTANPVQSVSWTLQGQKSSGTKLENKVLTIGADETADALVIVAKSANPEYDGLVGSLTLPVKPVSYQIDVTTAGGAVSVLPGGSLDLSAELTCNNFLDQPQVFRWSLDPAGREAYKAGTKVTAGTDTATATLTVDPAETGTIKVKVAPANTSQYGDTYGIIAISTTAVDYSVTITGDDTAFATQTVSLTGQVKCSNPNITTDSSGLQWAITSTGHVSGTKLSATTGESVDLVLGYGETKNVTVTATSNVYGGEQATKTIQVTPVTFTADIQDAEGNSVVGETVVVYEEETVDFTPVIHADPDEVTLDGTWTWTSSKPAVATVDSDGTVTMVCTAQDATTIITAAYSADPSLTASFTVQMKWRRPDAVEPGSTVTVHIDQLDWYVLEKRQVTDTDGTVHNAALLLMKETGGAAFSDSNNLTAKWEDSSIRASAIEKWVEGNQRPEIAAKSIEVNISTRAAAGTVTEVKTADKVFLLSEADVFGTSNGGADKNPQPWEYTLGAKLTTIPNVASNKAWWLRSPAGEENCVACVDTEGTVTSYVCNTIGEVGTRLAFWYDLGVVEDTTAE